MMNYYNSLSSDRDIWLKNGVGDEGRPRPRSYFKVVKAFTMLLILAVFVLTGQKALAQSTANYALATTTNGSLTDMSTGTTQLVGPSQDDAASSATNIGFDFWFMGVKHTQFSASSNGMVALGGAAIGTSVYYHSASAVPLLAPFGGDLETSSTGKVHYKLEGTAPNRTLVIEFLNMGLDYTGSFANPDGTYQVRLYETTNQIQYVYGSMNINSTAYNTPARTFNIGLSSNTTANTLLSITNMATNATSTTAFAVLSPAKPGSGTTPLVDMTSASNGSRKVYTFTPTAPAAPTGLNLTAVAGSTMTLNWTDNSSNESGFAILRSTDNVNFTQVTTAAANAVTYNATGLSFGTTYYWKVLSLAEVPSAASNTASATTTSGSFTGGATPGIVTIGDTTAGADYGNLTTAFAAINAAGLANNIDIQLGAGYPFVAETYPIITSTAAAAGAFSIKVYPTVSGLSITSASTTGTLSLNGAGNLTFDGRINATGSTKDLVISNTATAGYAILFSNDAVNNAIKYCTVQGVNTSTTSGVIVFGTAAGLVTGNDNNTIDNCDILDGATTPLNMIYSAGTSVALDNSGNSVTNCNIANYFGATSASNGIFLASNSSAWTITGNKFYQSATRTMTSGAVNRAINIVTGSGSGYTINNNVIGYANAAGTGTTTYTGSTSRFIGIDLTASVAATSNIQGNTISGISVTSTSAGSAAIPVFGGIVVQSGAVNIGTAAGNTIGAATGNAAISVTSSTNGFYVEGIYATSAGTSAISNNTVGSINATGSAATVGPLFYGVWAGGTGGNFTINNNVVGSTSTANSILMGTDLSTTSSSATFYAIRCDATGNIVVGASGLGNKVQNVALRTTGSPSFYGYYNGGAAASASYSYNTLSDVAHGWTTTPSSGSFYGMYNTSTNSGGLTWNNNTIQNITNLNTTGTVYAMYNSSSTVTASVQNNTVNNISRAATATSGTLYCYYNFSSPTGVQTLAGNTFTNINAGATSGTTTFYGIYNGTSSSSTWNIFNNNISSITAGSGTSYVIYDAYGTTNVYNNTLADVTTAGTLYGVYLGSSVTTGNTYKNKIYNLTASGASGTVYGVYTGGGTTQNIYNNLIGDLKAPTSSLTAPAPSVTGLYVSSGTTVNAYYNTINLAATSTGTNFGTAAVYSTSTPTTVNFRNNIFVNTSTPNGTGKTVAYQRANTTLTNYAATSNNNDLYAGTPGVNNLLFFDTTNAFQALAGYKGLMASRDQLAISEAPNFLSTTGSSAQFLHINPAVATQMESGGATIASYTDDFDGDPRNGTTPDIGADEFAGTPADFTGPTVTYTPVPSSCSFGEVTLTATITDSGSGVPTAGAGLPVLYWKIGVGGSYNASTATSLGSNQYQFTLGTGSVTGDVIYYYIAAQDGAATPNVTVTPAAGAGSFTVNPPAAGTPPTTPASYSNYPALSGTFNVGTGQTYATLTAAVAAFNGACLSGPVTFILTDSTYGAGETFPLVLNANPASNATNTLTIKPATTATITGAVASNPLIVVNGADYVTIDGSNSGGTDRSLTITNTSPTAPIGVAYASLGDGQGAIHGTIKNCNVSTGAITTGASYGIAFIGSDNDFAIVQNNNVTGATVGIYALGNATGVLDNLAITGNTVTTNATLATLGIRAGQATGSTVNGNTVSVETTASTQPVGISLETGFVNSTVNGNLITKVLTTSTGGYGGRGITIGTGNAASNVTVSNNSVAGVNGSNWSGFGASSSMGIGVGVLNTGSLTDATGGVNLYYNSVNMAGSYSYATSCNTAALYVGSAATALDIRDNIFVNSMNNTNGSGTGSKNFAVYSAAPNTAFATMDFNDYYVSGAQGVLAYLGSDAATLAAVQTAFGQNANSLNVAANFTSATDLHLLVGSNVALDNLGTPIAGITTDFDGNTRSATPDMGMDEFATLVCSGANGGTASAVATSFCGSGSTTLSSTGYSIGNGSLYEWEKSVDLAFTTPISMGAASNAYANMPTGTITATTYYRLKVTCNAGVPAYSNVVTVNITVPATVTVSPNVAICAGGNTTLTASGAVTYTWSPAAGLSATTGTTVTANPSTTTTYSVVGVDSNGCTTAAATVTVTVNPYPSTLTINQTGSLCTGQILTLAATGGTVSGTAAIGTSTATSTGDTEELSAFGNRRASYHTQLLFTAAELSSAGIAAGPINSMAFTTTSQGDANDNANFVVKIGPTALTAFTNYVATTGFTTVFPSATYTHVTGVNTINFSTPYVWNGSSNIVIDMAYSGADDINNAKTYYTATTDNTVAYGYNGAASATLSTRRFNIILGYNAATTITWTPITDLYTDAAANVPYATNANASTVYFKSSTGTPVSFTATAANGSCTTDAQVDLEPVALPTFTVNSGTYCNGSTTGATLTAVGAGNSYSWSPATGLDVTTGPTVVAKPSVTTVYTVTATNNTTGCQTQHTTTVTVNDPPVVTSMLPLAPSAINGQNVVFTVTATGTGLTYQWFENGIEIPGETGTTLSITADPSMNGYTYYVEVTGQAPCTTATSAEATLTVDTTGITDQPDSLTVCAPNSAQFTVVAETDPPGGDITYGWEVNTTGCPTCWVPIADGADATIAGYTFSGSETNVLTLNNTAVVPVNWQFRAVLNGYITSDDATLTVKAPPAISTGPSNQSVCASGGTATFTVAATGDNLAYQWQVNTGSGFTNISNGPGVAGATSASLVLTNPALAASGNQYQVIVSGAAQCTEATSSSATLTIVNPLISTQPANVSVFLSNTTSITAAATSATAYQWAISTTSGGTYTALTEGATIDGNTYTNVTSPTLNIATSNASVPGNGYWFKLTASNGICSVVSNAAQMTITDYCTSIPTNTADEEIFNVTVNGNSTPAAYSLGNACSVVAPGAGSILGRYSNFRGSVLTNITQGQTVSFTIEEDECDGATYYSNGAALWIDLNHDGDFTDAGERLYAENVTTQSPRTITGTFVIPATSYVGNTAMRIIVAEGQSGANLTPCMAYGYGETEDYTINIVAAPGCTGTPLAGTVTSSGDVCQSGTATLTVSGYTNDVAGISLQWYNSAGPIAGANTDTYTTPVLTSTENYHVVVTCAGSGLSAPSNTVTVTVNKPLISGTTPASRCGAGSVALSATAATGNINWYASATGGSILFTGSTYNTPVITSSTTYYVENNIGGVSGNVGAVSPAVGAYSTSFTGSYEIFDVAAPVTLTSVDVYPTAAGTVTVELLSSSGALLQTSPTYTVTAAQANTTLSVVGTPVVVPVGFTIPAGTGYRLNFKTGSTATLVRNSAGAAATYGPAAGVTITGNSFGTVGYYYNFYNWSVNSGCSSTRTAVTATIDPAPALTLSSAASTVCAGASTTTPVTITSNVANFDTYTWSPAGVTGNSTSGYFFTAGTTTTFTLTGTNSTSNCSNIATYTLTVTPLPDAIAINPATVTKCVNDPAVLLSVTRANPTPVGGCLTASEGQYPTSAYTPTACNGSSVNVTTLAWAGEYSVVNVTAGSKYVFTSTGAGDYVTISDAAGTTVLAAGPSPVTWICAANTQVRFYSHTDAACGEQQVTRTRSLTCTPLPGAVFSPTTGLYTNAAATVAYTGTAVQQVYAKPGTTQTYTATVTASGCPVSATATVNVNPTPVLTAPATQTVCTGILTAPIAVSGTPSGVTFNITGGASIGLSDQTNQTQIPAFTPTGTTATITLTPSANGCSGTPVTFTINVSPAVVGGTVTGGTSPISAGQSTGTMTLSGHTGSVIRWESSVSPFSVWTPIVNTTTTYSDTPSQTTRYRAVVQSGACGEAASDYREITVFGVTFTSITASQACLNSEATITMNGLVPNSTSSVAFTRGGVAQPNATVVANGSGIGTFNVLVTAANQNITVTQITRTDVTPNPSINPSSGNSVNLVTSTGCTSLVVCGYTLSTIDQQIYADLVANTTAYRWRITRLGAGLAPTTEVQTLDTPLRVVRLIQFAQYRFNTTYRVEVATLRAGVWGPYGPACNVTTPVVTTNLINCPQTVLTNLTDIIYANNVPYAAGYRFRITDPLNPANTQTFDRALREIRMNLVTAFQVQYNKVYNVEVAVKNTDGTYMPFNTTVCTVKTPVFPTTSIQDSQCEDYAPATMDAQIFANSYPGAVAYVFNLSFTNDPADGIEVTKPVRMVKLSEFTGLVPGATYNIRVRLVFDLAAPSSNVYGKKCTVVVPALARTTAKPFNAVAYPNPFADNFNINVTTSANDDVTVKVYDMTGRLLETHNVQVAEMESLQVGDRFPSGVYNVIVSQGDEVKTLRVVKR